MSEPDPAALHRNSSLFAAAFGGSKAIRALGLGLACLSGGPAVADIQIDLEGPSIGIFRMEGSGHGTLIELRDPALSEAPSPICPADVSIRIAAPGVDSGEVALPCENWRARRDGFIYTSVSPQRGVDRLKLGPGFSIRGFAPTRRSAGKDAQPSGKGQFFV